MRGNGIDPKRPDRIWQLGTSGVKAASPKSVKKMDEAADNLSQEDVRVWALTESAKYAKQLDETLHRNRQGDGGNNASTEKGLGEAVISAGEEYQKENT
jgi:hypothetical protein